MFNSPNGLDDRTGMSRY